MAKTINEKIESLKRSISVQIFDVSDEMIAEERQSAENWNPILKSWIKRLDDIQNDIGYETKKTRLLSQSKIRSDFERKVLPPEIH